MCRTCKSCGEEFKPNFSFNAYRFERPWDSGVGMYDHRYASLEMSDGSTVVISIYNREDGYDCFDCQHKYLEEICNKLHTIMIDDACDPVPSEEDWEAGYREDYE